MSDALVLDPAAMSASRRYFTLISLLVPRPIAWVTSRSAEGVVNLAPFSFFGGVSGSPPIVSLGIGRHREDRRKDTARNILETREFVVHLAELEQLEALVASSAELPPEESEVDALGLALAASSVVAVPGLAAARVRMECVLHRHLEIGDGPSDLILGEVKAFCIDPSLVAYDGRIHEDLLHPVGRLGGTGYAPVERRVQVPRPPPPSL